MERRDFLKRSLGTAVVLGSGVNEIDADRLKVSPDNKELSAHRIDGIKFTQIKMNYPRQVGRNSIKGIHGFGPNPTVATLLTDKGASGWGLLRSGVKESQSAFSVLKGKPLTDLFTVETGVISDQAKPFDIPLHDLAGNILKKPVYKLLGGKKPETADCYSGMIYFDDLDQPDKTSGLDKLLEECRYDHEYGYRQLKVKIGRGNKWMPAEEGLQRDIEVTKLIVKSFPDCQILVDGNDGFTTEGIIEYLKGIGDTPLFWVEEPFIETVEGYQKLRAWTKSNGNVKYLADGEANPDLELVTRLENSKLIDICLLDIMGFGFTPWRKMMPELKRKKILASPHNWGDFMKTIYTVQLTGALGNTATIEGVTCSSDDVDFGDYKLKGGRYTPSEAPGFGMKLLKGENFISVL